MGVIMVCDKWNYFNYYNLKYYHGYFILGLLNKCGNFNKS
jgi:hypothetical protein